MTRELLHESESSQLEKSEPSVRAAESESESESGGVGVGKFSSAPTPARSRSRLHHFFIISFLVKMETTMEQNITC